MNTAQPPQDLDLFSRYAAPEGGGEGREGVEMSVREALMRLRRVKSVTIASGDVVLAKRLTALDPCQERLLELCGVVPT
jgi:hypothetical protein